MAGRARQGHPGRAGWPACLRSHQKPLDNGLGPPPVSTQAGQLSFVHGPRRGPWSHVRAGHKVRQGQGGLRPCRLPPGLWDLRQGRPVSLGKALEDRPRVESAETRDRYTPGTFPAVACLETPYVLGFRGPRASQTVRCPRKARAELRLQPLPSPKRSRPLCGLPWPRAQRGRSSETCLLCESLARVTLCNSFT